MEKAGKTSEHIWLYVKRRPFIKEMLKYDLVNYSRLARKLCRDIYGSQANFYAAKAALMRMAPKIRKKEGEIEGKALEVLKNTSLTIRSKVVVLVSSSQLQLEAISSVKSGRFYVYIAARRDAKKAMRSKSVVLSEDNLNLFILSSGTEIETTPGVISTILHLLAAEGINVREFISSYTDTLLVIKEADTSRAYELLSSLMK